MKYSFFFRKLTGTLQIPSLDHALLENCTLSNSIILLEDLIKWETGFVIFFIDHYANDTGNKNIAGKY